MQKLEKMAGELGELLKREKQTVAVAESSSGGLISASLLSIAGASAYFMGGTVIYTRESRKAFVDLDLSKLKGMEPLTEPMAGVFAEGIREKLGTVWGVAELGAAGPAGSAYGHPPGISVIAVDGPVKLSRKIETGSDHREDNMWVFADAAIQLLLEAVNQSASYK